MTPLFAAQVLKLGAEALEQQIGRYGIRLQHVLDNIEAMKLGARSIETLEKVRLHVELDPILREKLPLLDATTSLTVCGTCHNNFEVSEGHTCGGARKP